MNKTQCVMEKIRGTKICIKLPEDLKQYALNFLVLFNNYRTNKDIHYINNDNENYVYLIVGYLAGSESCKNFLDWVEQVGTILWHEDCNIYQPIITDKEIENDIDNLISCEISRKIEWY